MKIRGFRIEIGEINATLSKHPAVKECVTIMREDKAGDKKICSYMVPAKGQPQDIDLVDVRKYLKSKLPSYMVTAYQPLSLLKKLICCLFRFPPS